jgi:tetratricopeptide (TPR) repeat protein
VSHKTTTYRQWSPIALLAAACLLVGLYPVDRETMALMGEGERLAGQWQYTAALHAYDAAATKCPGCPGPWLRQGAIYLTQGRTEEAWEAYLSAIRRGGDSDEVKEGLARLYAAQGVESWAIAPLRDLLARRPGHGEWWAALGEATLAGGDRAGARDAYERALALALPDGQRQSVHDRLGMMCAEEEDECALAHFRAVADGPDPALAGHAERMIAALDEIALGSEPALARAKLGEAYLRRGDLSLAQRQFQAAVDLEPAYVDGHAYLGHVLSLRGESERAVQHLERAIALEPAYPLPHYFLGMHYVRLGWWITGQDVLVRAHDLDPSNPAICAAVADTYLRAEPPRYAVAEQWLHVAVDNAPDDPRFHLLLAHFYVDYMVDPSRQGVAVARFAVQLAPENSEAQETLGWAYHLAGKPDLALDSLTRARDLAPQEARIHFRLGEVYRAMGRYDLARRSYQQALDLDWNGPSGEAAWRAMGE